MINPKCSLRYIVKYFTWFMVVLFKIPIFVLLEQAKFLLEKHRSYVGARLGLWGEKFCNLLNVTSNYELR